MRWEYKYIMAADLPIYQAQGWEYVGLMKGPNYVGAHKDTMIVKREVPRKVDKFWFVDLLARG